MSNSTKLKKFYINGYAKTESLKDNFRILEVPKIIEEMIPKSPGRILDVVCGDGVFTQELKKSLKAKEAFGIDISPNAAQKVTQNDIYITTLDIDEHNLPFESDYFDFVYCGNLIELVLDPDHLLEELHRVLSKKGHLIISFPNISAWGSRAAVLLGYHPFYDRVSRRYILGKLARPTMKRASTGFIRLYTVDSFSQLAKLYGFRVIRVRERIPHSNETLEYLLSGIVYSHLNQRLAECNRKLCQSVS